MTHSLKVVLVSEG